MTTLEIHDRDLIDGKTSRSICDAVGERLQQYMKPQTLLPSPRLEDLLNALDRAEQDGRPDGGNSGFFR